MPDDDEVAPSAPADDSAPAAPARPRRRRPHGYGLVLLTIVLAIIVGSVGQYRPLTQSLSLILIGAALLLALRTAEVHPRIRRRAAVVVVVALLIGLLSSVPAVTFVPASLVLLIGAMLIAATSLVLAERLVQNPEVTRQTIIGALCVYLLMGLFFSFVFTAVPLLTGIPFFVSTSEADTSDYLYFSFVTLATVGYGDLVARSNLGRMLAATEGLTGQLYLVTVVALLVSNLNRPGRDRRD
jgi:hypothetical protein